MFSLKDNYQIRFEKCLLLFSNTIFFHNVNKNMNYCLLVDAILKKNIGLFMFLSMKQF